MPTFAPNPDAVKKVNAALAVWRQGDLALEENWFTHAVDPSRPLTDAAAESDGEAPQVVGTEVAGLVVVTQTCDIVRSCAVRPFVETSPLVEVSADHLLQIRHGRRPGYAFVPALEAQRLVADLDRVMTVEKSIVATWTRTPGSSTDEEARAFSEALARKRRRFAFPDDFTALAKKLHERLAEKHDKETDEGRALRALREVRVRASPSWDAARVEVLFYFVPRDNAPLPGGEGWDARLEDWMKLLPASSGRFTSVHGIVRTLDRMTAREYVESDPLDLDHLSLGS